MMRTSLFQLLMIVTIIYRSYGRKFIKGVNMFQMEVIEKEDEETTKKCSGNWKQYGQNCYLAFYGEDVMQYHDAETVCWDYGGDFASIHSAEENRFLLDYWNSLNAPNDDPFIGLRWEENVKWWTDGSPVNFTNVYQWPSSTAGRVIYKFEGGKDAGSQRGSWKGYPEEDFVIGDYPFICKAPIDMIIPLY